MQSINKIRHITIAVALAADRIVKLMAVETIPKDALILALKTRRFGANRKTLGGKTIVNDVCFDASFLSLKKLQEEVVEKVPLEHIEKSTNVDPSKGFEVNLSDVDWNTSFIEVAENTVLDTGKYFELTISFTLPPTT